MHPEMKKLVVGVMSAITAAAVFVHFYLYPPPALLVRIVEFFLAFVAALIGLVAFVILDWEKLSRIRRWRKLGFGPSRMFPRTDFERRLFLMWVSDALTERAVAATRAFQLQKTAQENLEQFEKKANVFRPKLEHRGPAGIALIRESERNQRRAVAAELAKYKAGEKEATRRAESAKAWWLGAWDLFREIAIGDGKTVPRNMIPIDPETGEHFPDPESYREWTKTGSATE